MYLPLLCFAIPLTEIKSLIDNYIDLRMQAMQYRDDAETLSDAIQEVMSTPPEFMTVPVCLPKKAGTVFARVSPEDYQKVVNASSKWRLCSSGYPIFVKRDKTTFETTYMHKLVFGDSAKHINGDRLDNRRENLVKSSRKSSPKCDIEDEYALAWADIDRENEWRKHYGLEGQVPDVLYELQDFKLQTISVVSEEMHEFKSRDKDLTLFNGHAEIDYDGSKHFSGLVKNGIPHGYGMLYEKKKHIQSIGEWVDGRMKKGMVVEFKPAPECMCLLWKTCPFREVSKVDVVREFHRV